MVHLYCLTYSTFVEHDVFYTTGLFIFLVTVFIKRKIIIIRAFLARHVVCLSLTALGCKTDLTNLLARINTLVENAIKHNLSDGLPISNSFS